MRYQKPVVMDISGQTRASGLTPMSCYNGTTVTIPPGQGFCQVGVAPPWVLNQQCEVGPAPGTTPPAFCIPGGAAFACFTGPSGDFVDTCTSGPQPID